MKDAKWAGLTFAHSVFLTSLLSSSKTSDVWNPAFISHLTPRFSQHFQPTNKLAVMLQTVGQLVSYPGILLLPFSQHRCSCSREFGEFAPLAASWVISLSSCMNTHAYSGGRSSMAVRKCSCVKVSSSSVLLLNAFRQLQVRLYLNAEDTFQKDTASGCRGPGLGDRNSQKNSCKHLSDLILNSPLYTHTGWR